MQSKTRLLQLKLTMATYIITEENKLVKLIKLDETKLIFQTKSVILSC